MKRRLAVPEKSAQSEIRTLLELNGFMTHHLEVFAGSSVDYEGRTRRFTEGTPGQADLIAIRPRKTYEGYPFTHMGCPLFDALYIEVKSSRGKSKKHQVAWQECKRKEGFLVLSDCRSWEDVVFKAKSYGLKVERAR